MATGRSLKLSIDGKLQVDRALTNKAWGNDELIDAVGVQVATVKNFRSGKAVEKKNFVKFCQALGLDWEQVADLGSPPAPNSGGAEALEKSESTTAENLQQNTNEAQGVQVQGSETTIVGHTVNVYQSSITSDLKISSSKVHEKKSLQFLIKVGEQTNSYWREVQQPMKVYAIQPLPDECIQFFEVDIRNFTDDVDPSFDITLISNLNSINVVHEFGIKIVSVANDWKTYGITQATEIIQQAKYEIDIPDIRSEIALELDFCRFPRLLEPRKINRLLTSDRSKKFILDAEKRILNYEVLLRNYIQNMPNYASIQFWIKTHDDTQHFSHLIHVFSI
jgi:DNA-binding Xre family transcriptional regulator